MTGVFAFPAQNCATIDLLFLGVFRFVSSFVTNYLEFVDDLFGPLIAFGRVHLGPTMVLSASKGIAVWGLRYV